MADTKVYLPRQKSRLGVTGYKGEKSDRAMVVVESEEPAPVPKAVTFDTTPTRIEAPAPTATVRRGRPRKAG